MSGGVTRILPIYLPAKVSVGLSKRRGENDAAMAVSLAAKIGVPAGTFLWADIEPDWLTSENWLRGWWRECFVLNMVAEAGFTRTHASRTAPLAWPYFDALVSGSDSHNYGQTSAAPSTYTESTLGQSRPAPGSGLRYHQSIDQYHTSNRTFEESGTAPEAGEVGWKKAPPDFPPADMPATARLLWSRRRAKVGVDLKTIPSFKPTTPLRVENTTVIWQYAIDCMKLGGRIGLVDLNLATQQALDTMWSIAD